MKINISELEELFFIIFNKANKQGFSEVNVNSDYYWDIAPKDKEDFTIENPELIVGSLIDDWESLKNVLNGANIPTLVDIQRLGSILYFFAKYIEESNKPF